MLFTACERQPLPTDWRNLSAVPIPVRENFEIAARGRGKDRSTSLSLLCGAAGDIHLLLRTRLPEPRNLRVPWNNHASMIIDGDWKQKLPIDMTLIALGPLDTILSPELAGSQTDQLARMIGSPPSKDIQLAVIEETGVNLQGKADAAAIRQFTSRCPNGTGPRSSPP